MADAKVILIGPGELGLLAELYNEVFSPRKTEEFFVQRFRGRQNVTMMVAMIDEAHAGFIVGFELMPSTFFVWLCGVVPDFRRLGVATQLLNAVQAWAKDHDYHIVRFECQNQHRPMLHAAITGGFDLVGIRWDTATANNVVVFEKDLS